MNRHFRHPLATLALLLFVTLACRVGPPPDVVETTPTAAPTSTPPPPPTAAPTSNTADVVATAVPSPTSLTGDQREYLASATVFIAMLQEDRRGELQIFGSGSGTIISADGLILTNAHVASPITLGYPASEQPDMLGIGLVEQADKPPVPSYLAEVVAVDGTLDLAVIRIVSKMDGSRFDAQEINLPFVPLGDSDQIRLGDNVNIFGFPGIGGETITFTRGAVSGFSSERPLGDRAWIKTDATIAGGNSGGLATNDQGELIGVPTRASAGTNDEITDCRVVQDTNGDGRLNENDTCIPIGGFINALRPISLAVPLIRAAQAGVAYQSPYDETAASPTTAEQFTLRTWAADFDANGCAITPLSQYETRPTKLVAVFRYAGLSDGQALKIYWLQDGERISESVLNWDGEASGNCVAVWYEAESPFPDGHYTVLIYADTTQPIGEASTLVGAAVVEDGVTLSGKITDADTGRGLANASLILLQPGVDMDSWLENPTDEAIYTSTTTNSHGEYKLPFPLQRNVRYEGVAFAEGYNEEIGYLEYTAADPAQSIVNLQLTK